MIAGILHQPSATCVVLVTLCVAIATALRAADLTTRAAVARGVAPATARATLVAVAEFIKALNGNLAHDFKQGVSPLIDKATQKARSYAFIRLC